MYDNKYDSKMHDITIPLMGFNGFHHAGNSEFKEDFEDFIGRESILDKLKGWLEDKDEKRNKKYSGAYLITGFRGMGKSAFVHKAINDIKEKSNNKWLNDFSRFRRCHYVPISINVGNDLLTSKGLLYIICKLLSSSFEEKTRWGQNFRIRLNILVPQITIFVCAFCFLFPICSDFINNKIDVNPFPKLILGFGLLLLSFLLRYVYYLFWKLTDWAIFITTWQIKKVFRHLNERIDSEMTISSEHEVNPESNVGKALSDFGLSGIGYKFKRKKENVYPIAQTSEIQDLLVSQLRLIKRLRFTKFRFIFIIDELDKVTPVDAEEQIIPEYENTYATNGNSTYHSRQKALAELLANMKYFISGSEAKFIFITGYDMYEATLADISNREFNIHSIFNGYINVSSFLRKTGKNKGADSMIEEYFCHLLLNNKDDNGRMCEDLGDYAGYFRNKWELFYKETSQLEVLLERRINFMRHFLTYLFYMSNGSPKKLAMYLEKYVRSKNRINELLITKHSSSIEQVRTEITLGLDELFDECDWFLYFDERNIQKIEFIHYLIYPMLKNLIAKSSIYNDKLLVSTSFMISNLYKFHKSGFSWRNLEYMPELLEINKMPELRDFIGGIMQFLNQTHVDEAPINLYKFKFPQRLSEEITFFSKTSEEVSYLFNFSHDELLSIKKLYYQQLEHYKKNNQESPALASIHHMLGDIYMLEENYGQAIFEFNEALCAVSRKDEKKPLNQIDLSNLLFKIRVSLKLGLAYEKRKTFDTAYVTYENLVLLILKMANWAPQINVFESRNTLEDVISYHKNSSSFFSNIRLTYLSILAKVAVLEKMDFGGITELDLILLQKEFNLFCNKYKSEIRSVAFTDFYTKLGIILFYKNGYNSNKFKDKVAKFRRNLALEGFLEQKFDECQKFLKGQINDNNRVNAPCMACQCFNLSIRNCMEELGVPLEAYQNKSRSLFFVVHLFDNSRNQDIVDKGNVFMMTMANALVGMGNTLLGCIKNLDADITRFFSCLRCAFEKGFTTPCIPNTRRIKKLNMNHYAKSILYFLAAAKTYELLTDYKSAYNIYVQILEAIRVYFKASSKTVTKIDDNTLVFCEKVAERAIECTFLHYDSINCAEIDTLKHEMGQKHISRINLHSLSCFPEIEIVIEKFYHLSLFSQNENKKNQTLKLVLNSRQMGCNKLLTTITQSIQNLYFKVIVNEEVLSRIMPNLYNSLKENDCRVINSLIAIHDYLDSYPIDNLLERIDWQLVNHTDNEQEKRLCLLDYLIVDSLYCLNKITELIAPLYSSTLYNNSFIGEVYEKSYNWSHILVCMRELIDLSEVKTENVNSWINDFKRRYSPQKLSKYYNDIHICLLESRKILLDSAYWLELNSNGKSRIVGLYDRINPESYSYQTGSFLMGNAIDFFNRAIEMHSSGKTYKEMLLTLFFLEDDLCNDSNYMNIAIERFLLNHNYVQKKLNRLQEQSLAKSTLLKINNYLKQ